MEKKFLVALVHDNTSVYAKYSLDNYMDTIDMVCHMNVADYSTVNLKDWSYMAFQMSENYSDDDRISLVCYYGTGGDIRIKESLTRVDAAYAIRDILNKDCNENKYFVMERV